jgi:UDPglucose 6-dehydrogenase
MRIVIAGYGPVGQAVEAALSEHPAGGLSISVDDPPKDLTVEDEVVKTVDGVVVCVATPMRPDGTCTTDHLQEVFLKYGDTKYLIKSAVDPVWLTQYANAFKGSYTYCPEFLRGSHAHGDPTKEFIEQPFAIYGGDDCRFWDELFRACLPNIKEVKYGTLEQAAFGKYVENCFLATKVTFFNEMYKLYHALGFEGFDQMVDMITLDPRVGRSHTQVPGPDGKFGYGGHCFPKDMSALQKLAYKHYQGTPILDAVIKTNEENRK